MPRITTQDGASLFYTDWGDGRPVVLLHGWALDQRMWERQVVHLAAHGMRCITYDRRGHGRSDVPGDGYSYDTLASDLSMVLQALDLTDVLLVAHSMGAGEAVRYLARSRSGKQVGDERVSGLVLLAGITPCMTASDSNPGGVPAEVFEASNAARIEDRPGWFRAGTPAYFAEPGRSDLTPQMQAGLDMCLQTDLPVLERCAETMTSADLRDDVRCVSLPTLVIHGDADASSPLEVTGQPTADLLPNGRLLVYPDGPHGLYVTHADRLNDDLLAFAQTRELPT